MATFPRHIPVEHRVVVARAARFVGTADPLMERHFAAKLPGDPHALRGIPVIGYGISGASPGTRP